MNKVFRTKHSIGHRLRARHRHGHGIHSPFLFHFIVSVIENKHTYYAYEKLKEIYKPEKKTLRYKHLLFFFRLANSFECNKALLLGIHANGVLPYIQFARANASIDIQTTLQRIDSNAIYDLIILSEPLTSQWMDIMNEHYTNQSCIVLYGIHKSSTHLSLWKELAKQWKHSIDFFHFGLLFNKEEVPAQRLKY